MRQLLKDRRKAKCGARQPLAHLAEDAAPLALVTLIALIALAGCSKQKKEAEEEPVVPVQVAEVTRDSIQRIVTAQAILYPVDQASIMPKISAPVRSFAVNRGDHVTRDQVVAVLENRDLAASVAENRELYTQAQAVQRTTTAATLPEDVTKAQQDVAAAKEAMDAAQKVYQSRRQLLEQGALARRLVDEANVAYVQAHSQYEIAQKHLQALESVGQPEQVRGAEAQTQAAKARYDAAEAQLSYSEIRSPIAGVVADRPLYPGEMAAAGNPLLTIMNISSVIARANIPVGQAASLKVGDSATIAQTDADIEGMGKVTVVSPAVDPNSTTVEVWVQAQNPGERFKPGATVRVSILAETIQDAIVIPTPALLPAQEGGVQVLVMGADSKAHERKIDVGVREPDKLQVLKGLEVGEKVITVGGVGLEDGAKVRVGSAKESEKPDKDDKGDKSGKDAKDEKDKK
ncbi:MAG TPA: efflux RND transporter periplasmic adaptor subunit [Bryobacteraceae bacterium]|nr:efflux RND transporter periplasmic adaptor subunit [Bryobacteraceae bacterium]